MEIPFYGFIPFVSGLNTYSVSVHFTSVAQVNFFKNDCLPRPIHTCTCTVVKISVVVYCRCLCLRMIMIIPQNPVFI